MLCKDAQGLSGGIDVLYIDFGGGHTSVCVWEDSPNSIHKKNESYRMKVYLNKPDF